MPIIEVFLSKENAKKSKEMIGDIAYQALRTTLGVKEGAKFVYVYEFEENEKFIPSGLFGLTYSENTLLIRVTLLRGRTTDQKKALYKEIAASLEKSKIASRAEVICCLIETDPENWSFGAGEAQFLNQIS